MKTFEEIKKIIKDETINENETKELVSKIVNNVLFDGKNVINCTNIPFVFDEEIQLDYENIDMIINIKNDDSMEFEKLNITSETTRKVKKETFIRKAKRFNELNKSWNT